MTQIEAQATGQAADAAAEGFNAGEVIIEHVANSAIDHPLIHLPTIGGIDFSVTKHVFMLWVVAAVVFLVVTMTVRRYLRQDRLVPTGFMSALESIVEFIRDTVVAPSVGAKWTNIWTPLLLTFFVFILSANAIGMIPIFEVLALLNHWVLHAGPESFLGMVLHGGSTVTSNFNVTAALAVVSFFAIIVAGSRAHGAVGHWKNLVPHGVSPVLAVAISALEIIVILVQAYVFTLLTAVFIGMAIHAHH